MSEFIIAIVTMLLTRYAGKWSHWSTVLDIAKRILASKDNPTTSITDAVKQAIVQANLQSADAAIKKLEAQRAKGQLEIREAEARGKRNAEGMDITILPRDGTEEFKSLK